MLKRLFTSLFKQDTPPAHAPERSPSLGVAVSAPQKLATPYAPVYPAADDGFDATITDSDLLATQKVLLGRIRQASDFKDNEFEQYITPVLLNVARYSMLLPATVDKHYAGAGGSLRLSLELGFHMLQSSRAVIFSAGQSTEHMRIAEPRWRYAAFITGLLSELYRIPSTMIVTDDQNREWPCFVSSLATWLESNRSRRYFIRFLDSDIPDEHARSNVGLLTHLVVPANCIQYIQEGGAQIVSSMLAAVNGSEPRPGYSQLDDMLHSTRNKLLLRDIKAAPSSYGKSSVGVHMEPHLVDAMRQLISDGTWTINVGKSRIWFGSDGMYVIWKSAHKDIVDRLSQKGVNGIPSTPETIISVLKQAKILEMNGSSPYWSVKNPETGIIYEAIKVNQLILVPNFDVEPLEVLLAAGTQSSGTPLSEGKKYFQEPKTDPATPMNGPETPTLGSTLGPIEAPPAVNESGTSKPASEGTPGTAKIEILNSSADINEQATRKQAAPAPEAINNTSPDTINPDEVSRFIPEAVEALLARISSRQGRELLRAVVEDFHAGDRTGMGKTEHGFAITRGRILGYGAEEQTVVTGLLGSGWLYSDPSAPNRKYHDVKLNQKEEKAIIILAQHSKALGLN